jgi:pimeloyl-ACP methyl ester carboxylesterase
VAARHACSTRGCLTSHFEGVIRRALLLAVVLAGLSGLSGLASAQPPVADEHYCDADRTDYDPQDVQRPDAPPIQLPPGFTRRRLSIGGYSTPVIEAGPRDSREAIVFLHGNPGSALDYLGLFRSVAPGSRVVALDLLGFGKADKPYGFPYGFETGRELFDTTLRALGVDRVHLVGHDIGSVTGIDWAAANPTRLASAVLLAGGIVIGYQEHHFHRIWKTPLVGEQSMYGTNREGFISVLQTQNVDPLPREFLDRNYDDFDRGTRCAILTSYRGAGDVAARAQGHADALRPYDRPALVIWGDRDPFLPADMAQRSREAFPRADVHVFEATGHWPFVEEEERTVDLMRSFLRAQVAEQAGARIRLTATPNHIRRGRRTRVRVRAVVGEARRPLAGALVSLLGRRARTDASGRASLVVRPRRAGLVRTAAVKEGLAAGRKSIRVLRR